MSIISTGDAEMNIKAFFHADTATYSYAVIDPVTHEAAVIDPVLDYNADGAEISTDSMAAIIAYLEQQAAKLLWILETHVHADHLSAAYALKQRLGGKIGVGVGVLGVQSHFNRVFDLHGQQVAEAAAFDHLFEDGEHFSIGELDVEVLNTPGHTNDSVSYLMGDAVFVGDTLFMPDSGTARCDFPGGDPAVLYQSVQRLFKLPASTRIFICHDYAETDGGKPNRYQTTVAEQRAKNIHLHDGIAPDQFISTRKARDITLEVPRLILPSVQVNIRAGRMPEPEQNGGRYLKLPVVGELLETLGEKQ